MYNLLVRVGRGGHKTNLMAVNVMSKEDLCILKPMNDMKLRALKGTV